MDLQWLGQESGWPKARAAGWVAAIALLGALTAFAYSTRSAPSSSKTAIILTAKKARECLGNRERYRTPSASEVQRLESSVVGALKDVAAHDKNEYFRVGAAEILARMSTDVRYYVASADGFIQVYGFCADMVEHAWQGCPPLGPDGGSCVWSIRYDVAHGTFDHFGAHGEA